MKKNRILLFVCLAVAIVACVCLAACNFGGGGEHPDEENPCAIEGHRWEDERIEKEPTCTEAGQLAVYCYVCGETKMETLPALGHTEVVMDAIAPTCYEDGLTEGKFCDRCGEVFVEQQTVKGAHTLRAADWFEVFPTEEEGGVIFLYCESCDENFRHEIPAIGDEAYTVESDDVKETHTIYIEGVKVFVAPESGEN